MWTTAIVVTIVVLLFNKYVYKFADLSDWGSPAFPPSRPRNSGGGSSTSAPRPEENPGPEDPNKGFFVTERDAHGASERIKYGGLITQKRDVFGNWVDV